MEDSRHAAFDFDGVPVGFWLGRGHLFLGESNMGGASQDCFRVDVQRGNLPAEPLHLHLHRRIGSQVQFGRGHALRDRRALRAIASGICPRRLAV